MKKLSTSNNNEQFLSQSSSCLDCTSTVADPTQSKPPSLIRQIDNMMVNEKLVNWKIEMNKNYLHHVSCQQWLIMCKA